MALHACGGATDLVIGKCERHRAAILVSPCCYGNLGGGDRRGDGVGGPEGDMGGEGESSNGGEEVISYPRSKVYSSKLSSKVNFFSNI